MVYGEDKIIADSKSKIANSCMKVGGNFFEFPNLSNFCELPALDKWTREQEKR